MTSVIDAQTSRTSVTVQHSMGRSLTFSYYHGPADDDYESPCFRCADSLVDSDGFQYDFTTNGNGMLSTIGYPQADGSQAFKTFLYEIDDNSFTSGCSAFWQCETALTGVVDEEQQRYASWAYKNQQDYYSGNSAPDSVGWAYKSYHGSGDEIDDHVEIVGYTGQVNNSDDRIVVRQHAYKLHYDIDHWDSSNESYGDDKIVEPRIGKRQDLSLDAHHSTITRALNIEQQGVYYSFYDAGVPSAQGAISRIRRVTERDGELFTTSKHYVYDDQGQQTVVQIRETSGADETLLRVTDQQWDLNSRQLLWRRVSADGTAATAEREVALSYYPNGRLQRRTETDLTDYSLPYTTAGRQRQWNYSYSYHDEEQARLASEVVDGPRTDVADISRRDFDVFGNLIKVTNAAGHIQEFKNHRASGQPQLIIDHSGVATTLSYTPRGQLSSISRSGVTTVMSYYANKQLKRITQADGSWLEYSYTSARKLKQLSNHLGEKIVYQRQLDPSTGVTTVSRATYDALGVLVATGEEKFDALGRVYEVTGNNNQLTKYQYFGSHRRARVVQSGHALYGDLVRDYFYDGLYRLTRTVAPKQSASDPDSQTLMSYSIDGQLTSVIDPLGLQTDYQHDGFGLLMQRTSPNTGASLYAYDEAGNLTSRQEANGLHHLFQYDAISRPINKSVPGDGVVTRWHYDLTGPLNTNGLGRLGRVDDASGVTNYGYDSDGRLALVSKSVATPAGSVDYSLAYGYDASGQLDHMIYPSGQKVSYSRQAGRVTAVYSEQNNASNALASAIVYRPFAGISSFNYGNGLTLTRQFDSQGRLAQLLLADAGQPVDDKAYQYDSLGNIATIEDRLDSGNSQQFYYDHLQRLIEASGSYGDMGYSYDAVGNRLTRTGVGVLEAYGYSSDSQQLQTVLMDSGGGVVARELSHDPAGNLQLDKQPDRHMKFEYDHNNRLTRTLKEQL